MLEHARECSTSRGNLFSGPNGGQVVTCGSIKNGRPVLGENSAAQGKLWQKLKEL